MYIHTYILWGQFLSSLVNQTSGTLSLVVLYHHWSSLIWHEDEDFPMWDSPKPKMTTSATLGLSKNCLHTYIYVCMYVCNCSYNKNYTLALCRGYKFFFVNKLGVTSLYYISKSL